MLKSKEDEQILELKIEYFIWNHEITWLTRFKDFYRDGDFSQFQLFAIFNRFCDTDSLVLHDHWSRILLKKICKKVPDFQKNLDFTNFVKTGDIFYIIV